MLLLLYILSECGGIVEKMSGCRYLNSVTLYFFLRFDWGFYFKEVKTPNIKRGKKQMSFFGDVFQGSKFQTQMKLGRGGEETFGGEGGSEDQERCILEREGNNASLWHKSEHYFKHKKGLFNVVSPLGEKKL